MSGKKRINIKIVNTFKVCIYERSMAKKNGGWRIMWYQEEVKVRWARVDTDRKEDKNDGGVEDTGERILPDL